MLKIRSNRLKTIQVGIWQRGETLEVVWFDEKNQACFLLTNIHSQFRRKLHSNGKLNCPVC